MNKQAALVDALQEEFQECESKNGFLEQKRVAILEEIQQAEIACRDMKGTPPADLKSFKGERVCSFPLFEIFELPLNLYLATF